MIITMNSSLNQTFDQFLNSLNDIWLIDIVYLYIFPLISISGTLFNILNLWIFSHKDFASQPSFFYLRVMSGFHLVCTILVIAYGICFSPRFLPRVNTYYTSLVQLIYVPIGKCFDWLKWQKEWLKFILFSLSIRLIHIAFLGRYRMHHTRG